MPAIEPQKGRMTRGNGTTVHNRPSQRVYVFGSASDDHAGGLGEPEAVEMSVVDNNGMSRRGRAKSSPGTGSQGSTSFDGRGPVFTRDAIGSESELTYILHAVEAHHTLQGIALQYRVSVDQLKRLNNLWREDELHSRKTIKVPASRYGALYTAVMEGDNSFGVAEPTSDESRTHTTMRPLPAAPVGRSEVAAHLNVGPDNADCAHSLLGSAGCGVRANSAESGDLLAKYDKQLGDILEQERQRSDEPEKDSDGRRIFAPVPRRHNAMTDWYPSDWRIVLLVCLALLIAVPIVISKMKPRVL
ncbi:uncharacterized protein MONBRDRAFT_35832 [Monosiga brevicollis MX1]|uniref:LysM domain-containing protein n=1 Tax=Monosiga brevicollis TaxID=81824 RepID=A9US30_MONBE|nr:uncharacterized protein MONBRDRAFT_35832 [Monosiga brevicollis MX1]EDQ92031.1 predicted protein [Monosiga brevicollis MX1]|eukprot:XP_001743317.1 hypothetical protein [Monosiga brevicollis MX1]